MSTSAQFFGVISDSYYTDNIAVFFTEQSDSAFFCSIFDGHFSSIYIQEESDFIVYDFFNFCDLFCSHCFKVAEVKTCSAVILIRTLLFYMVSKYHL